MGGVALLVGALLAVWFLCWRGRGNKRPYYYGPATADDMLAPGTSPPCPLLGYEFIVMHCRGESGGSSHTIPAFRTAAVGVLRLAVSRYACIRLWRPEHRSLRTKLRRRVELGSRARRRHSLDVLRSTKSCDDCAFRGKHSDNQHVEPHRWAAEGYGGGAADDPREQRTSACGLWHPVRPERRSVGIRITSRRSTSVYCCLTTLLGLDLLHFARRSSCWTKYILCMTTTTTSSTFVNDVHHHIVKQFPPNVLLANVATHDANYTHQLHHSNLPQAMYLKLCSGIRDSILHPSLYRSFFSPVWPEFWICQCQWQHRRTRQDA